MSLEKTYIGYADGNNPLWFKRMCANLFRIRYFNYARTNTWSGLFKKKKINRVVEKLKADNRLILQREFGDDDYRFVFDMWRNHRGQSVPVLELWLKKKKVL